MSRQLINRSPDLKRLRDEGYELEIRSGHLLVHHVPYVNARREIAYGTLVTPLGDLAGDRTARPQDHVIHFIGEHPCDREGNIIGAIQHSSGRRKLAEDIEVDHSFSNKPPEGYPDYYAKVTRYCRIISEQAEGIDPSVRAQTYKVIEESDDLQAPFNYLDTNSSRAEIDAISAKFHALDVAIIGLGGTGSYVLDFVAKTPVREIHLFDGDLFHSHNAFRAPGAASLETLRAEPKKVLYLHNLYSRLKRRIVPHEYYITESNLAELSGMNFVFICADDENAKQPIIKYLLNARISFIDVGMGIHEIDGRLTGALRVTTGTVGKHDHIESRISFARGPAGEYDRNIQIAELNAVNAALAVIKWKKIVGMYHDLGKEMHASYDINVNKIFNDEIHP